MSWLYKNILEPIFFRWKCEIQKQGRETWTKAPQGSTELLAALNEPDGRIRYDRDFITYKYINKFDGSVKIKKKYLN